MPSAATTYRDEYRFLKGYELPSDAPDTFHTHALCPHVQRMNEVDVYEPGEELPTREHPTKDTHIELNYCPWCRRHGIETGDLV